MRVIVNVNPFLRVVNVSARINGVEERGEFTYGCDDFDHVWYTVLLGDRRFEIMLAYNNGLQVTVEDASDGTEQKVKLEISLK